MTKEKLSSQESNLKTSPKIKKTAKQTRKSIVINIDDRNGASTIMQGILDGKIKKEKITKKMVKDLAKAGVFHRGRNKIMGDLLLGDYAEIFGGILSEKDIEFLFGKSYEIEKIKNTHKGRSIFDIEDEIDKYFKKNKGKLAA